MHQSLMLSSLGVLMLRVVGVALQLATTIVLAWSLSLAQMGVFAALYAFLGLTRAIGPIGTDQAGLRVLAELDEGQRPPSAAIRQISTSGLALAGILGCGLMLLVGTVALSLGMQPAGLSAYGMATAILALPAYVIMGVLAGHLRGLGRNMLAQAPESLALPVLILAVLGLAHLRGGIALDDTALALSLGAWLTVALQIGLWVGMGMVRGARIARADMRVLLGHGWGIFQAMFVTALTTHAPIFLTAALLGAAATGLIEIALRFGKLASLLTTSISTTFNPVYVRLSATKDHAGLRRARIMAGLMGGVPATLYALGIWLFADSMLPMLLSDSYTEAALPMALIAGGIAVSAGFGPASNILLMTSRAHIVRNYSLLRMAVFLALSVITAPHFGIVGVAFAFFIGAIFRDVLLTRRV